MAYFKKLSTCKALDASKASIKSQQNVAKNYWMKSQVKATHPTSTEIRITTVWKILKDIGTVAKLLDTFPKVIEFLHNQMFW